MSGGPKKIQKLQNTVNNLFKFKISTKNEKQTHLALAELFAIPLPRLTDQHY